MHELSLAVGIVDQVKNVAKREKFNKVSSINIEIGELSGVIPESLKGALSIAVLDTILENTAINFDIISGLAICKECKTEYELHSFADECPKCNGYLKTIIKGKELLIKSIDVD